MKRRIERPFLQAQDIVGDVLEPARNAEAVLTAVRQRLENEQFDRTAQEVGVT